MSEAGATQHRQLKISILRYNPQDPNSEPHMQTFPLEEADGMTLFIALNEIREKQDASLQFDFVCRAGICGSCGMLINGRPGLACRTLTMHLGEEITLAPLPVFELIGDLSVNTGKWMRAMSERLETWIHTNEAVDLRKMEERMEPQLAEEIYELDRCIECGCCVAACGTARMRRISSARWGSTRSPGSRLIRATSVPTKTFMNWWATMTACSVACRFWDAMMFAPRNCPCKRKSHSSAVKWSGWE